MSTPRLSVKDVTFTHHFLAQAVAKGFTAEQISGAVQDPYKVTEVTRHPGQMRFCGQGIAVVIDVNKRSAITAYLDGVVTEMRPDQVNDPAARASRRLARAS